MLFRSSYILRRISSHTWQPITLLFYVIQGLFFDQKLSIGKVYKCAKFELYILQAGSARFARVPLPRRPSAGSASRTLRVRSVAPLQLQKAEDVCKQRLAMVDAVLFTMLHVILCTTMGVRFQRKLAGLSATTWLNNHAKPKKVEGI